MNELLRFVIDTNYTRIPYEAIENAKKCILDGLGVAIAGSSVRTGQIIMDYARELKASPESSVIAGGFKTCSGEAALANGTLTHILDYDDSAAVEGAPHLTSCVMPVVFALGEKNGVSGRKVLEAYILGWEIGAKIGKMLAGSALQRGWHTTSIVGCLAAAVAGSKILSLNYEQVINALGIAASHAGGLVANFGTDSKPLHAGNAARSGVVAAILASKGFSANKSILEGANGFLAVFSGKQSDPNELLNFGSPFNLESPGPSIKIYSSCGTSHPSISAVLDLASKHKIQADQVREVYCRVTPAIADLLKYSRPQTIDEAKFSLEYCIAVALLYGEVTPKQFEKEKIYLPEVKALIEKISVIPDIKYDHIRGTPRVVTVKLLDGREYSKEVRFAKGSPENPISWNEVCGKFKNCTEQLMEMSNIKQIMEIVSRLEELKNINTLTEKCLHVMQLTKPS